MFGKFFASTFTGSMVGAGLNVFATWGYIIANTRADGFVDLNPPIIAATLGCDVKEIESAIATLCSPDAHSRSKKENGCRLVKKAPFLYFVPTYSDYRSIRDDDSRREYMRNYMREYRDIGNVKANVNTSKPPLAHTEAEAEAEAKAEVEVKRSKERSKADARASRLPATWTPPQEWVEWAIKEKGWSTDKVVAVADMFRDFWIAKAGKDGRKLDWFATWRNWCRNQREGKQIQSNADAFREAERKLFGSEERDITHEADRV